jgi:choline dehydrogenase
LTKHLRLDRAALLAARWFLRHDGPFASNGATANIFLRSSPELERPDIQLTSMSVSNTAELWCPGLTAPPTYCFNVRIGNLHPASRGWVRLRSADPADKPRIWINMYGVKNDLDVMIKALRISREIYQQSPMRELVEREIFPGADLQDNAALEAIIRNTGGHRSHPVGTCRMGVGPDAVVDAALQVHGIAGLRVADASIMPDPPSGNTNVPTIMIGEKAADLIRGRSFVAAG